MDAAKTDAAESLNTKKKSWLFIPVLIIFLLAFYLLKTVDRQDNFINNEYYRVLYEASDFVNNKLSTLERSHRNLESADAIRSLLPTYQRTGTSGTNENNSSIQSAGGFTYQLTALEVRILNKSSSTDGDDDKVYATLKNSDVLAFPSSGFTQFIFANSDKKVITTRGNESIISFDSLDMVAKAFANNNKSVFSSFDKNKKNETTSDAKLPSFSTHIDMELAHGRYRVFVFPFQLQTKLTQKISNSDNTLSSLYLIGLIPIENLNNNVAAKWNIPLLVITIISIFFLVAILKLYLQPKDQYNTQFFRVYFEATCYLFFIGAVSLIITFLESASISKTKQDIAEMHTKALSYDISDNIIKQFEMLSTYRTFYQDLNTLITSPEHRDLLHSEDDTKTANFYQQFNKLTQSLNQATGKKKAKSISHYVRTNYDYERFSAALDQVVHWQNEVEFQKETLNSMQSDKVFDSSLFNKRVIADGKADNAQGSLKSLQAKLDNAENSLNEAMSVNSFVLEAGSLASEAPDDFFSYLHTALNISRADAPSMVLLANNQTTTTTTIENERSVYSYITNPPDKTFQLLSAFVINPFGILSLPPITYKEVNAIPKTIDLSHRYYYKNVRDQKGWTLLHKDKRFKNVYIQRLRNVNNGTIGTTISMPLLADTSKNTGGNFVLAADVLLKSVTTPLDSEYDFTNMVINRNSGQVLFHNQQDRALTENLFHSGNSQQRLVQTIKSGNTAGINHPVSIKGIYHGQKGRFVITSTLVDEWAAVVFYPDHLESWFMTNQFLFYFVCLTILIGSIKLVLMLTSALETKSTNKRMTIFIMRRILFVNSTLICLAFLIFSITKLFAFDVSLFCRVLLVLLGLMLTGSCIYWIINKIRGIELPVARELEQLLNLLPTLSKKSSLIIASITLVVVTYLLWVSTAHLKAVSLQYQQLACANANEKAEELNKIALTLYPNSITKHQKQATSLLPTEPLTRLESSVCRNSSVMPQDYPNFASSIGNQHLLDWLTSYFLNTSEYSLEKGVFSRGIALDWWALFWGIIGVILILISWFFLHSKIVWTSLYFHFDFISHIEKIAKDLAAIPTDTRNEKLKIQADNIKLNGVDFDLLMQWRANTNTDKHLFNKLSEISPLLHYFSAKNIKLPNLKITLSKNEKTQLLSVELWDVETCLEKRDFRENLLLFIMELKALVQTKTLEQLTIYSGFHCLQRVAMQDGLKVTEDDESILEHVEFLSWSECLMDFNFIFPKQFSSNVDAEFLAKEVKNFAELKAISQLTALLPQHTEGDEVQQHEKQKTGRIFSEKHLATVSYIMLHAEPFYRFKWELCTNSEKLALFNLANNRFVNPSNSKLIENLALNGLIRVSNGKIKLVNESFTYFVLNAESNDTFAKLYNTSNKGAWKNNRLAIIISMVVVLIGIALFSGESLLIVVGSLAGVLTTIASMTNSANLIRNHFK